MQEYFLNSWIQNIYRMYFFITILFFYNNRFNTYIWHNYIFLFKTFIIRRNVYFWTIDRITFVIAYGESIKSMINRWFFKISQFAFEIFSTNLRIILWYNKCNFLKIFLLIDIIFTKYTHIYKEIKKYKNLFYFQNISINRCALWNILIAHVA